MSCKFVDSFQARPGRNFSILDVLENTSGKLLMMGRGTARNM